MVEQEIMMCLGNTDGVCIDLPGLGPTNVCDLISCPLKAGNHYQLTEKVPIPEAFPDVSV